MRAFLDEVVAEARKNPEEDLFVRALPTKVTVKNEAARTPASYRGDKEPISHELTFIKLRNVKEEQKKVRVLEIVSNIHRLMSQLYHYCSTTEPITQLMHSVGIAATASPK